LAKILYITPFFNYPPTDGASLRSINILTKLSEVNDVEVLTYKYKNLDNFKNNIGSNIKIHLISSNFDTGRSLSFIKRLFSIRLPGFSAHDPINISNDIDKLVLKEGGYDFFYFATQLVGQAVLVKKQAGIYLIDLYDIFTDYTKNKFSKVKIWKPYYWLFFIEAYRVKKHEKKIISKFDHVFVTCEENFSTIMLLNKKTSLFVIPNGINMPKRINRKKDSGTIMMVANFEYSGNKQGIKWFYKYVWKKILLHYKNAKLLLVGNCPDDLLNLFKDDNRVSITGIVNELGEYYAKAGCVILPLYNDGGTKTKLLEAISYQVPIVSTKIGAKGFENFDTITIADNPDSFALSIVEVLSLKNDKNRLQFASSIIKEKYTWTNIGDNLNKIIQSLL